MKKLIASLTSVLVLMSACTSSDVADPQETQSQQITACDTLAQETAQTQVATVEGSLPNISVDCLDGTSKVDLARLRGPLIIPVWASWCAPCAEEMPIINEFQNYYSNQVKVLAYALLDENSQGVAALENWGVAVTSLADPEGEFRSELSIQAPPTTLFINENGQVVYRHFGAIKSLTELKSLVARHLLVEL